MRTHRVLLTSVYITTVLAAGCASPIHILTPGIGTNVEPVPQVVANFTTNFNPAEAWGIYLDGNVITGFSPPPAPGVTSTAPIVFGFGTTGPGAYVGQHKIETNATCGMFCVYNSETVNFAPPQLLYNGTLMPSLGNVKQFVPTPVFVAVQFDRSVPITVTITETSPSLKIMKLGTSASTLRPVGTPLTVTIPPTSTKADFFIEGDSIGSYTLNFSGAGVTPGFGAGKVSP
ncbi:MAG: hypothetical protein HY028_09960 [Gammaproteobacteria bacterium]|nr:hypothetical protein [Gammaproteobacteria bacterium]